MDPHYVLIAPVVTEKSTMAQAHHKYTFVVHPDANKIDILNAIERVYGVKVNKVHIIPVLKKVRLGGRGRVITKRPARKKAIVTLQGKTTLDVNKFKK